ncbi:MAG: tetratricopeptide repeat protein [Anaerolineae bacterium]|nr:tetratricopeptide repeat protein [Anaerolineae bacterium]
MPNQVQFSVAAAIARIALVAAFLLVVLPPPASDQCAAWWAEAEFAVQQGDIVAAQSALDRVLVAVSDDVIHAASVQARVYALLVDAHLAAGRYDAARVYLYALADVDGWTPARREQLRTIFDYTGEIQAATALLMAELDTPTGDVAEPANPAVLRELAQLAIDQLDWAQAETTLAELVTIAPDDAWAFYQLGLIVAPQNPAYAADYLIRAALNPDYTARADAVRAALSAYETQSLTDAHTTLGITLTGLGEWPFAERVLQIALDVNAVNPTALAYRGFVRDQQGRDGLADIEAARAMDPNDPVIYYMLGMHWRLADAAQTALVAFEHAYWLDSENPALAAEVGRSWQQLSEFDSAEEWLRRAVELAPDDLRWQITLAVFYADTGFDLEETGLPYIEELVEKVPFNPNIQASLGWAYAQTGDLDRAYDRINIAIGADPDNVRSRYYFGAILERQGNVDSAASSYWFVVDEAGSERGFGLLAARALQRLGYITP